MKMNGNIRVKMLWTIAIALNLIVPVSVVGVIRLGTDDTGQGWFGSDVGQIEAGLGHAFDLTFANLQTVCATPNISIVLPSCNITFMDTLDIVSGVRLYGVGNGTIFYASASLNADMINIDSQNDIWIEGIKMDGNNWSRSQTDLNYSLIDVTGTSANPSQNNTITHCTFINGQVKSMIDLQEDVNYNTISFCNFDKRMYHNGVSWGFGGAIWISGDHNKILFNNIKDTWASGIVQETATGQPPACFNELIGNDISGIIAYDIYMEEAKSNNATISNNVLHDSASDVYYSFDSTHGTGILATEFCTISDNLIYNIPTAGILLSSDSNSVSGNIIDYIYGTTEGATTNAYGIWLSNSYPCANNSITSNNINNIPWGNGTRCPSVSNNNSISNNIYTNCKQGITNSGTNNSFNNNKFIGITRYGMEVTSSGDCTQINDNTFVEIGLYGIYMQGENCQMNDNGFYHYGTLGNGDAIKCQTSGNHTINDNTINYGGDGGTSDCIELADTHNTTVMGNHMLYTDGTAIKESGGSDGNILIGNSINGITTKVTVVGANTVNQYNQ